MWAGISRAAFYERYANDERFADIVTRMREECEVDARRKFELGVIEPRLASLWMGKYGYSAKQETAVPGSQEDDPITKSLKEAADAISKAN